MSAAISQGTWHLALGKKKSCIHPLHRELKMSLKSRKMLQLPLMRRIKMFILQLGKISTIITQTLKRKNIISFVL